MKIDKDLRAAIQCAARGQIINDTWEARTKAADAAIADFFTRHPAKRKRAASLVKSANDAESKRDKAVHALCAEFGLRRKSNGRGFEFGSCCDSKDAFTKAGGKPPAPTHGRWKSDAVIAELASADPKQGKAILKKYGIRWE